MPLHDSVKTIEKNIGQFSGYMCEFSGEQRSHCFFSTNTSETRKWVIKGLAGVITGAAVLALSSSIAMAGLVCAALLLIAGIVELIKHYNASGQSLHMPPHKI